MKRTILIIAFISGAFTAMAQTRQRADTAKRERKEYFVKLSVSAYNFLLNSTHELKEIIPYNTLMTPEEKNNKQLFLDKNLDWLQRNIKIDSLVIKNQMAKAQP
jgi:hypothetical protein